MINLKKLLPLLVLCSFLVVSCGVIKNLSKIDSKQTTQEWLDKKAVDLANLKGATVESVTQEDGAAALKVTFDSGILFDFGKSELGSEAKVSLDRLVKSIADMPDSRIRVYGHTDIVGTAEANQAVSAKRAKEVAKYLEEKGISPSRITAEGLSFTQPVADNSTEAGRAKNRRVEIYIIPARRWPSASSGK